MKLLLSTASLIHAAHCRNLLDAAGIRAELRNVWLAGATGDIPFQESAPVWLLDADREAEAPGRAGSRGPAGTRPARRCGRCGEWHEAQFGACWHCGASREPTGTTGAG